MEIDHLTKNCVEEPLQIKNFNKINNGHTEMQFTTNGISERLRTGIDMLLLNFCFRPLEINNLFACVTPFLFIRCILVALLASHFVHDSIFINMLSFVLPSLSITLNEVCVPVYVLI